MLKFQLKRGMWLDTTKLTIDQVLQIKDVFGGGGLTRRTQSYWMRNNPMLVWEGGEFIGYSNFTYISYYGEDAMESSEIAYEDLFGVSLADSFFLRYDSLQEGNPDTKRVWKYGTDRVFIVVDDKPTKRHLRALKRALLNMEELHTSADKVANKHG